MFNCEYLLKNRTHFEFERYIVKYFKSTRTRNNDIINLASYETNCIDRCMRKHALEKFKIPGISRFTMDY